MKSLINIKNGFALLLVIVVWGYVMKSKFGLFDSNDTSLITHVEEFNFSSQNYSKDTFKLELSSRDPFLGTRANNVNHNRHVGAKVSKKNQHQISKLEKQTSVKSWPKLSYFGYVKNRSKGKQACLIQINGQISKMFLGSKINDIQLKLIYKDSVVVLFNGENKTLLKN